MYIKCETCSHCEKVNLNMFVGLIGTAVAGGGYWAWVGFLFAGTGFAMPICIAIMAGGVAMLKYSNEIVAWISKRYNCPECGSKQWIALDDKVAEEILSKKAHIQQLNADKQKYETEIKDLHKNIELKHQELKEFAKQNVFNIDSEKLKKSLENNQKKIASLLEDIEDLELLKEKYQKAPEENKVKIDGFNQKIHEKTRELETLKAEKEKFSFLESPAINNQFNREMLEKDIDFLFEEIEKKDSIIHNLMQDKEEWDKLKSSYEKEKLKIIDKMKKRFSSLYPNITINDKSFKRLAKLSESRIDKFEKEIKNLQDNKMNFRDDIVGTDVKEIGFDTTGRIYLRKTGNNYIIVSVGDKNTQLNDIKYLKENYRK